MLGHTAHHLPDTIRAVQPHGVSMSRLQQTLISLAVLGGVAAGPAWAASSASSASSEGSSASVGSLSTSVEKSSKSSSKDDKVAEGDYRIIDMAAADQQPGKLRLTLQAVNGSDGEFHLILPQEAAQQARLATGAVITASHQPYGLQFAAGAPREAFFLALRDEWYQELQTRAVTL
jgi:hypothetical protein